jgi:integrase
MRSSKKAGRRPRFAAESVGALIVAYKLSPEWARLAAATRATYATYLRILEADPNTDVAAIKRRDILAVRDAVASTRGTGAAQGFIRASSALFTWAVDREWIEASPVTRIRALPGGTLPAWTAQQLAAALAGLAEPLRRAVVLAAHTGQRRGDLCTLRWDAYDGPTLRFNQQKTGQKMVLSVPPALRAELDAWRRTATTLTILDDGHGRPWHAQHLSARMRTAMARLGLPGLGIHGVRKHVAASLADAGATTHEIAAVTGHRTLGMVQLYTAAADRERLAEQAVNRLSQKPRKPPVRR